MSWNPNPQFSWSMPAQTPGTQFGLGDPNSQFNFGAPAAKSGWDLNMSDTLKFGLGGLNTIGNIWGAWQAGRLAKDQLNFTKKIANANLDNQIKSYNTALEDRSRSRAFTEGQSAAEAQAYVDRNRLSRNGG